jgi:hypothetical protein
MTGSAAERLRITPLLAVKTRRQPNQRSHSQLITREIPRLVPIVGRKSP